MELVETDETPTHELQGEWAFDSTVGYNTNTRPQSAAISNTRNNEVYAMKCPHCLVEFHDQQMKIPLTKDIEGKWYIISRQCPSCVRANFWLAISEVSTISLGEQSFRSERDIGLVWPRTSNRSPVPPQVPSEFAEDYQESCLVLADSPKASSALSRRCLQQILREKAGVKLGNLYSEIQEVLNSNSLPSDIAESIDLIRNIGNFAAHPTKSESSGEIVPVEHGEAEWCLDVIEMLYDFYFVRPDINKKKREAINQKLAGAGKSNMLSERSTE